MIRNRLCDSLYPVGRATDAGESLLKMVNTLDEERHMSGPSSRWVSGEFVFNQSGGRALETPHRFHSDISPFPKITVKRPRT